MNHQTGGDRRSPRPQNVDWRQIRRFAVFCLTVAASVISLSLLYRSLLLPFLVGAFFAYLLLPLVNRLEAARMPRVAAVSAIVFAFCAVSAFAAFRIVPILFDQVLLLLQLVPRAVTVVLEQWVPFFEETLSDLGLNLLVDTEKIFTAVNVANQIRGYMQSGIYGLWATGTTLLGGVLNFVLVPFIAFFLLLEHRRIVHGIRSVVPRDLLKPVQICVQSVNVTLRSVIKGQATVAAVLTVLYVIGFSIVNAVWGLQSAVAIAVVAGVCRIIPYFDVLVGATLSIIVLLSNFQGWGQVLGVTMVFVVVQSLDGILITPRIIGERIGLHPVIVILSVLAFGDWFGFWGVLLVIPIIAVVKTLLTTAMPYYKVSGAYFPPWWRDRRSPVHRRLGNQIESDADIAERP